MNDWETEFDEALMRVQKEFNDGKLIQEESIKVSLYYHLRKNLEKKYTVFTEFKYYWRHRPHHEGPDFDITILKDWKPGKELHECGDSTEAVKRYRYNKVVGLIEIKLASSLNRMWGEPDSKKTDSVRRSLWMKDIEKFRKLWRHPSHLRKVERAYLCLFEKDEKNKDIEDVEVEIRGINIPKDKILVKRIPCSPR